jgi:acyl-CoA reductase-like NAD-dependent aldehyde dehydrogenase
MKLTDEQINILARKVAENLGHKFPDSAAETPRENGSHSKSSTPIYQMEGIFATIDEAVAAAEEAFQRFSAIKLEKRDEIIASIRKDMLENVEPLSREAHGETGLGRVESKIVKNRLVTQKTPGTEDLKSVSWSGDHGLTLVERAPYGVIAAITPTTNPTSTIICNTIGMLAAGNSVVFNVHPNAVRCSCLNIQLLNKAVRKAGGPPNLVTGVSNPTIESAQALMRHPGVKLLVVTGGPGVVKEAMTSGKRAICAGPGNPPVVVDETADIVKAAGDIVFGASLDNNIICTDEKEVFVVDSVADQLLQAMQKQKAFVLTPQQLKKLEKVIFSELRGPRKPGIINKNFIGKNASVILGEIGITVDESVLLAVAEVDVNHPLIWTEQMMPVMPVARVRNADEGIDLSVQAEHGFRHTASMHSKNIEKLSRMARAMNCSIFVKNGPNAAGLGYGGEGYCSFSIASPTGDGLTGPRSFTRERRCTLVDYFRIV